MVVENLAFGLAGSNGPPIGGGSCCEGCMSGRGFCCCGDDRGGIRLSGDGKGGCCCCD